MIFEQYFFSQTTTIMGTEIKNSDNYSHTSRNCRILKMEIVTIILFECVSEINPDCEARSLWVGWGCFVSQQRARLPERTVELSYCNAYPPCCQVGTCFSITYLVSIFIGYTSNTIKN